MIKQNVTFSLFCDSFSDSYKDNFTYGGKRALFDYLEQLSDDTGIDIELDTIALCCDYSEYESAEDCATNYYYFTPDKDSTETIEKQCREYLESKTQVIDVLDTGRIIIKSF